MVLTGVVLSIFMVAFYIRYWVLRGKSKDSLSLWTSLIFIQVKMFFFIVFTSLGADFHLNDEATTLMELMKVFSTAHILVLVVYIQNKIILLSLIETKNGRRVFILSFMMELIFINCKTVLLHEFDNEIIAMISMFALSAFIALSILFSIALYNLNSLQQSITEGNIEASENRKYKFMFNSLQDAIFLVEDCKINFMNIPARQIFKDGSNSD